MDSSRKRDRVADPLRYTIPELDSTDVAILQFLLEDARRSYCEVADEVGLSPPPVSNRVERLQDPGVIQRFTLELDRTQLSGGDETLILIDARPSSTDDVASQLTSVEGVEHVFQTVESRVVAKAVLSPSEVHDCFTDELDEDAIEDYHVESVLSSSWHPELRSGDFDIECAICENIITDDGEMVDVDEEEMYHVCCSSCAEEIVDQYDALNEAADG